MKGICTANKTNKTDEARWTALVSRTANGYEPLRYGVRTTGIYCRIGCAARLPKRQNVVFFESCADAEEAGFRPCQRCAPHRPVTQDRNAQRVEQACRSMECADEPPSLATLARDAGVTPFHFHRIFKRITGVTPKAYANAHRTDRVRTALRKRATVTEAIYTAGFNSSSRFYEQSTGMLGMAPVQFRGGAKGESIEYAIGPCELGKILVATSRRGVCAILLGDDPEKLINELKTIFPRAQLALAGAELEQTLAQLTKFVQEPKEALHLPLDVRGTAFQRRVWEALQKIPLGQTLTYAEVAARLGSPKAVRAVGSACAANVLAVAVPCHRVVRSDGSISNYRWGSERKRALLRKESSRG